MFLWDIFNVDSVQIIKPARRRYLFHKSPLTNAVSEYLVPIFVTAWLNRPQF